MNITVEYAAQAKDAAGVHFETIEVAPVYSLQDITEIVCREHGEKLLSVLVDEKGKLRRSILVTINDAQVFHDETVVFSEGDRVFFLPPVSGG